MSYYLISHENEVVYFDWDRELLQLAVIIGVGMHREFNL
jgi:hypothetical protein